MQCLSHVVAARPWPHPCGAMWMSSQCGGKVQKHACGGERKCFASSGSVSSGLTSVTFRAWDLLSASSVESQQCVAVSSSQISAVGWIRFRPVEGQRGLVVHPLASQPPMSKWWSKLPVGSCRPYSATRGTKTLKWGGFVLQLSPIPTRPSGVVGTSPILQRRVFGESL